MIFVKIVLLLLLLCNIFHVFARVSCYSVFTFCDHCDILTPFYHIFKSRCKISLNSFFDYWLSDRFDVFNFLHNIYFLQLFVPFRACRELVMRAFYDFVSKIK
jgi:hypothetical protein